MMRVKVGNITWDKIGEFFDSFAREGFDLKYERARRGLDNRSTMYRLKSIHRLKSVNLPE